MRGRKIIFVLCLICFASSASREQQPPRPKPASDGSRAPQSVSPPPKPADDGPSLEVTVKFIQDKMTGIRLLAWAETRRAAADQETVSVTDQTEELINAVAEPQGCTISYHLQTTGTYRGLTPKLSDKEIVFDLKQIEKITVESREQECTDIESQVRAGMNKLYALSGAKLPDRPGDTVQAISLTVNPAIFAVRLHKKDKSLAFNSFHVDDEELANRLARAITRAVEICTPDKKREPF